MRTWNNWKLYVNKQEIKGKLEPKIIDIKLTDEEKAALKSTTSLFKQYLNGVWVDADTKEHIKKKVPIYDIVNNTLVKRPIAKTDIYL